MGLTCHTFNPSQPEIKANCQIYNEFRPESNSQSDFSLFYQFQLDETSSGTLPVIPDGCFDLLFYCNPIHPYAVLATSPQHRCSYRFHPKGIYFGVRFYPEQSLFKLKCSMKELLQQQQIPLFDALELDEDVMENLARITSFDLRIHYFLSYFKKGQLETSYDQNIIKFCVNTIYATCGYLNLRKLVEETGYSDRYIRIKFEEYIGFSPKKFSQIVRLQHSVNHLLNNAEPYNDIIYQHGFYDKAHFYKGFKNLMSLTPRQYKSVVLL